MRQTFEFKLTNMNTNKPLNPLRSSYTCRAQRQTLKIVLQL